MRVYQFRHPGSGRGRIRPGEVGVNARLGGIAAAGFGA